MEIQSQNEHPGEDVVVNNSLFTIRFNPTPFNTTNTDRSVINCALFLFICPVFLHSYTPLASFNPTKAPFSLHSKYLKFKPAYFVYKGEVHFGYQVYLHRWAPVKLKVQLCIKSPSSSNNVNHFELAQLMVFDNEGDLRPIDVRTIVIFHPTQIENPIEPDDPHRIPLRYPLPYYQSPQLYTNVRINARKIYHSTNLTIGSETHLLTGLPDTACTEIRSITGETLGFVPQISHPAKRYLLHCYRIDFQTIEEKLLFVLLGQAKFTSRTDSHLFLPPCCTTIKCTKGTQTYIFSNDAATQLHCTIKTNHAQTQTATTDDPDKEAIETILKNLLENAPQSQNSDHAMLESNDQSPIQNNPMMVSNDMMGSNCNLMMLDPPDNQVIRYYKKEKFLQN